MRAAWTWDPEPQQAFPLCSGEPDPRRRPIITRTLAVLAVLSLAAPAADGAAQAPERGGAVLYRVPVTGVVELGLAPFIERSLREAEAEGAAAVILDMDTPGGRVDAAERIADAVNDAAIPVYTLVNRRAFSAGALIALATDGVYMRPGSVMGAATPVSGAGEKAPEKIVSAMRSSMRALAEARGLDPRVAEAMVDEDVAIEGVVEEGKLLTLTTEEAVRLDYAVAVEDWDALAAALGAADAPVRDMEVNWAERTVRLLTHPLVSPFLLSLGLLGILIEIKTPGLGLAGGAGVIALSLFFGSHLIIGLAGLEALLLFGAGVVLVGLEILVVPGLGVVGFAGGAAMVAGLYMSLIGEIPTMADFTRAAGVLATALILVLVVGWALIRRLPSNRRFGRSGIFLTESTGRDTGYTSALRRSELVGLQGVALTDLRPAGTGVFGDERIDVVSESEWIEEGSPIRIVASEGYRHVVRRIAPPEAS